MQVIAKPSVENLIDGKPSSTAYENRLVVIFTMAGGVAALDAQAVFYLMPFIVADLGLRNTQVGMIGAAVLISWSIAAVTVAQFSDRIGRRKPFLVGAFVLFAIFSAASAFARTFVGMFSARFLMGCAEGPVIPIQQSIMLAESSPHRRGLNMGLVQNFGAQLIGSLLSPILLVWIATRYNWHAAFLIAGGPGLAIAFLVSWLIHEPTGSGSAKTRNTGFLARIPNLIRCHNMRLCLIIGTCSVAWFFLLLTFLPLFMTGALGLGPQVMSLVMAAIGAAGVVSSFTVPGLSDRIGRRKAILGASLLGCLAPLGALAAGGNPWILATAIFIGCMMLGTFPLFMATVPLESVPSENSALAAALIIAVSQIAGGVCGPLIGGILADRLGLVAPLYLAVGLAMISAASAASLFETCVHQRGTE